MFTFDSVLLSAQKFSNPTVTNASLSSSSLGVNILTLSTNDVGIAFNKRTTLVNVLSTITINGSTFAIDAAYTNNYDRFALVRFGRVYSVFNLVSAQGEGIPLSAMSSTLNVVDPQALRRRNQGYAR